MAKPRDWIVGMDLSARSHGAIRFARWLQERSPDEQRLRGVYVGSTETIEREQPGAGLPGERACLSMRATAESLGAASAFEAFEVVQGDAPEEVLARVAEERDADGLIVGRAGAAGEWSLVSLGRVARRLLRHVPRPVVVVPPNLDTSALGRGPVVIAAAPVDHAVHAIRFGRALADALDLPTLLVYVIPDPAVYPVATVDPAIAFTSAQQASALVDRSRLRASAEHSLQEWLREHGLGEPAVRAEPGRKGWTLVDVARSVEASMIVCGSRRLSLADRIFQSSMGTEVAAQADCPVVVVPPQDEPTRTDAPR
jgi:nucleotide-binding universal stress UspA family protein